MDEIFGGFKDEKLEKKIWEGFGKEKWKRDAQNRKGIESVKLRGMKPLFLTCFGRYG